MFSVGEKTENDGDHYCTAIYIHLLIFEKHNTVRICAGLFAFCLHSLAKKQSEFSTNHQLNVTKSLNYQKIG